jgi:MFS family permease
MNAVPTYSERIRVFMTRYRTAFPILLSLTSLYFFAYFQRIGIPGMIFDELQIDLNLTASGVTLLGAMYLYVYGGMQLFVGLLSDRHGFGRVFLVGSVALAAGSLVFPLCHQPLLLYGARALVGFGGSLLFICLVKGINHLTAPRHFAIMLSLAQFLGFFGGLAATYPLAALSHAVGWRRALLLAGLITAVLTVGLWRVLRRAKLLEVPSRAQVVEHLMGQVLRNRELWKIMPACAVNFAIYFVAQATIGKKLLADCFQMTPQDSSAFMFIMLLISMVGTLLSGFILKLCHNRFKVILITGWFMLAISCGGLVLALSPGLHSATGVKACYLGLAAASFVGPIYTAGVTGMVASETLGTAVGFMNGALYVLIAVLANGSGLILDLYRNEAVRTPTAWIYPMAAYRWIFIVCLGLCAIALPLLLRFREPRTTEGG